MVLRRLEAETLLSSQILTFFFPEILYYTTGSLFLSITLRDMLCGNICSFWLGLTV